MRLKLWAMMALLVAAGPLLSACSTPFAKAPVVPPVGWIYQNTKAPLTVDFDETTARPGKTGSAEIVYICGWPLVFNSSISTGDTAIKAAAQNGGIQKVSYADYETYNILGIYSKFTVHAYGE